MRTGRHLRETKIPPAWRLTAFSLFALLLAMTRHSPEPLFEGKPFQYWLDSVPGMYFNTFGACYALPSSNRAPAPQNTAQIIADLYSSSNIMRRALVGVRALGTNHLEMLVSRLQAKDLPFEKRLLQWGERLRFFDASRIRDAQMRRRQALSALAEIGKGANRIVPQLIDLTKSRDGELRMAALFLLETIAPDEVEFIAAGTTSPIPELWWLDRDQALARRIPSIRIPVQPAEGLLLQYCRGRVVDFIDTN